MTKVRATRVTERAGVNEFRSLMESAGHIVQEIDGGNDQGEDCYLSFTRLGERTGEIVAVQVKSGGAYRRPVGYGIPCRNHLRDWTLSRIPVIGVVYDPELRKLFWVNMTEHLLERIGRGETPKSVPIGETEILDATTVAHFVASASRFIEARDGAMPDAPRTFPQVIGRAVRRLGSHRAVAEVPIGGIPYELGVASVDFRERHPRFDSQAVKVSFFIVLICAFIMTGPGLYKAAAREDDGLLWNGWIWLIGFYGTVTYLYRAGSTDPERKRARLISWSAHLLLACGWYVGVGEEIAAWPVNSMFSRVFVWMMPAIAQALILCLGAFYAEKEAGRRRRLRAAYPKGLPGDVD
ncbi:DUF4365 domain-containing protein [Kitasatospora purpeofusca]|uniref:DUF4365 domain-containing protein n=1 Tax=Kitasatospora purpeofusca TaxID=67352 RepID=UPI0036D34191